MRLRARGKSAAVPLSYGRRTSTLSERLRLALLLLVVFLIGIYVGRIFSWDDYAPGNQQAFQHSLFSQAASNESDPGNLVLAVRIESSNCSFLSLRGTSCAHYVTSMLRHLHHDFVRIELDNSVLMVFQAKAGTSAKPGSRAGELFGPEVCSRAAASFWKVGYSCKVIQGRLPLSSPWEANSEGFQGQLQLDLESGRAYLSCPLPKPEGHDLSSLPLHVVFVSEELQNQPEPPFLVLLKSLFDSVGGYFRGLFRPVSEKIGLQSASQEQQVGLLPLEILPLTDHPYHTVHDPMSTYVVPRLAEGHADAGQMLSGGLLCHSAILNDNHVYLFFTGLLGARNARVQLSQLQCVYRTEGAAEEARVNATSASLGVAVCPVPIGSSSSLVAEGQSVTAMYKGEMLPSVARVARMNPGGPQPQRLTSVGPVPPSNAGDRLAEEPSREGPPTTSLPPGSAQGTSDGKSAASPFFLCACLLMFNRAQFLSEWVVYHARMGVERVFVYDNNSEDGTRTLVTTLLSSPRFNASWHPWPWLKTHQGAFSHCLLRARSEQCAWVLFTDVDEFLVVPDRLEEGIGGEVGARVAAAAGRGGGGGEQVSAEGGRDGGRVSQGGRGLLDLSPAPINGTGSSSSSNNITGSSNNSSISRGGPTPPSAAAGGLPPFHGLIRRAVGEASRRYRMRLGQIRILNFEFIADPNMTVAPKEGVTLGYTCRRKIISQGIWTKTIVRSEGVGVDLRTELHKWRMRPSYGTVVLPAGEFGKQQRPDRSARMLALTRAVIFHYSYQVWDVFKLKLIRRASSWTKDWNKETKGQEWHQKRLESFCNVHDERLRHYMLRHFRSGSPHVNGSSMDMEWHELQMAP